MTEKQRFINSVRLAIKMHNPYPYLESDLDRVIEEESNKIKKCTWKITQVDDDFLITTTCGETFDYFGGSIDFTRFKLCPFCLKIMRNE